MSTEEKARQLMAQERLDDERLQENMLARAEEEVENEVLDNTEEKARELLTQQRLDRDNLDNNMLTRAAE